jgi:hypothetical protein|tara:strand:+ start:1375 stop:1833 length:459 start_codon:yes stop_codon:yes gene_type:complete
MALMTATDIVTEAFYANFDPADIKSRFIDLVEDSTVKPILGETLFSAVSGGSPSAEEIVLRDTYVKPLLAFAVKSLVLANNSPRISNVGAAYVNTPNATSTDDARQMAMKQNETLVQQLKQRLIDYLRDNANTFGWSENNDRDFITNNIFII